MNKHIQFKKNGKIHKIELVPKNSHILLLSDGSESLFALRYNTAKQIKVRQYMFELCKFFPLRNDDEYQKMANHYAAVHAIEEVLLWYSRQKTEPSTDITKLLNAKSKSELKVLEKKILIAFEDFISFLTFSHLHDYKVTRNYFHWVDQNNMPTAHELHELKLTKGGIEDDNKPAKKCAKKIIAVKNTRKIVSGFLIERGDEWHIFKIDLTQELYAEPNKNHFGHEHMHYTSYLFGRHDKQKIWDRLCADGSFDVSNIHIKIKLKKDRATQTRPSDFIWLE